MSEPFVTVLRDIEREPHTFAPYVMASWCGKAATELERLSAENRALRAVILTGAERMDSLSDIFNTALEPADDGRCPVCDHPECEGTHKADDWPERSVLPREQ